MKSRSVLIFCSLFLLSSCFASCSGGTYKDRTIGIINNWDRDKISNYVIRYCNYDGTILDESPVLLCCSNGGVIYRTFGYQGEKPTRPDEGGYYYSFSGWDTYGLNFIFDNTSIKDISKNHIQQSINVYAKYDKYSIDDLLSFEYLDNGSYAVSSKPNSLSEFTIKTKYNDKRVTALMTSAYANNTSIKKLSIEEGIKTIGSSAFERCSSLEKIEIPNSVDIIGGFSFHDCISLKEVSLPNSITNIYRSTFNNAKKLSKIEWGNSLKQIDEYAFYNCSSLSKIVFPEKLEFVKSYAFKNCDNILELDFNSINRLQLYPESFANAKKLKKIDFLKTDGVYLYDKAFSNCEELEEIKFPQKALMFMGSAFEGCTSLRRVIIPNHVMDISKNTFDGCSNDLEVYLESTNIGYPYTDFAKYFKGKLFIYSEEMPNEYGNYWHYGEDGKPVKW